MEAFDVPQLADSARANSAAMALGQALKNPVGRVDSAAVPFTHLASISRDVMDTAMALVRQRAMGLVNRR